MPLRLNLAAPAALLAAALLAGCAGYSPRAVKPGMAADEVVSAMGRPTARHALPGGGERLEYARGPLGLHTYMVDLDAQGRVVKWEQVLDEAHFQALPPGISAEDLQRTLGRPAEVRRYARVPGDFWSYRFEDPTNLCRWWQVPVINGQAGSGGYGPDPRCDYLRMDEDD